MNAALSQPSREEVAKKHFTDLQMHVTNVWGPAPLKLGSQNCLFWDGFELDKIMPDAEKQDQGFYPPSVSTATISVPAE